MHPNPATIRRLEKATEGKLFALAQVIAVGVGTLVGPPIAVWLGDAVSSATLVRLLVIALGALSLSLTYVVLVRWRLELEKKEKKKLSMTDKSLFRKYDEHLGDGVFRFLREQDMGSSFSRDNVLPFYEYVDRWKGPQFEFVDPEVEESRKRLDHALRLFVRAMVHHTYSDGDFVSMGLKDHDVDSKKFEARDQMNALGHDAADAVESFIRLGKRKISESENRE